MFVFWSGKGINEIMFINVWYILGSLSMVVIIILFFVSFVFFYVLLIRIKI